jgi:cytochrome c biogenesis protein CcmG, thiol:disulfide interchange protein DsbE
MRTAYLAAWVAALTGCAAAPRPAAPPSASLDRPLVLSAPDLEGRTVDVGALRGRVLVVDFWATWCEPCRASLPALDSLVAELGPRGLAAFAVSFDEEAAPLAPFLQEVPVRLPVLWDRGGETLAARFEIRRLPTSLIVDRRGVIRYVHQGWTAETGREQRREVERLLAEP